MKDSTWHNMILPEAGLNGFESSRIPNRFLSGQAMQDSVN